MKKLVLNSPAKLNLYLNVLGKRSDGFHEIETVFERISLSDQISLRLNSTGTIRIKCLAQDVPTGPKNLAYQAASLLKKDFSLKDGVEISIKKNIPVGSGLGGASSNAAVTLLGLNRLWHLNLSPRQLTSYARRLGSDVPFFLSGYRFALGRGRGDELKPLSGLGRFWHLVVSPGRGVSTKSIYLGLNLSEGLTNTNNNVKMLICALKKRDFRQVSGCIYNSLEAVTQEQCPVVAKIKHYLQAQGLDIVGMSGSGSAVFAIVRTRKEAERFGSIISQGTDWQTFVVRTL